MKNQFKPTETVKIKLFLIGILILNFNSVFGQICGTPSPVNPRIYPQENSNARQLTGSSSAFCIDVFFHIVRNTNGTNAFTIPNTDEIVNNLNLFYSTRNIIINNAGMDYIDNTDFVTINDGTAAKILGKVKNRSNVINYYIVSTLWNTDNGYVTGTANSIPSNNLVIRRDEVFSHTSAHELGHCLSLFHTFEVSNGIDTDGTQCRTRGDLVCDTPPDNGKGVNGTYNPDMTNIMSYYHNFGRILDHFTDGQGVRMRNAIPNESILQNISGISCTKITPVNDVCYPQTKTVNIINSGGATASWTSSDNVRIVWSNNTSAGIRGLNSNSSGNGWIRARLSNGITLQENFTVGKPSSSNLRIMTTGNGIYVFSKTWQELIAYGGDDIEWRFSTSVLKRNAGPNSILIYPTNSSGSITIGIRTKNECGSYSDWIYRDFIIYQRAPDGGIGIMH